MGRKVSTVRRVQTPTLSLVIQREEEIKSFKPKEFFIKSLIALDDAETRVENKLSEKFKSLNDSVIVDTVAVLTKTVGVRWEEEAKFRPNLGDTLESSTLKISDGLAQVEFLQGATVVLEGPVDFSIENPNEGKLSVGKLRAIVPKVATGFTINLPKGRVIDLGTDFGLHVHPGGSTELFVYQGNVIYEGTTDANEKIVREITGGESIFVDPYGHLNWVEMPSEPFISAADLAFRSMEESQRRHASWIDLSNSISQRETTMLYLLSIITVPGQESLKIKAQIVHLLKMVLLLVVVGKKEGGQVKVHFLLKEQMIGSDWSFRIN